MPADPAVGMVDAAAARAGAPALRPLVPPTGGLSAEMERAYERLRTERCRSAGVERGWARHVGMVAVSDDGDQLWGDGCTAQHLESVDPKDLGEVSDVSLCDAALGDDGAGTLAEWIAAGHMPDLESVDVSGARLGATGAEALSTALRHHAPKLETLRLDASFRQEEACCDAVARLLRDAAQLREVSLFSCWVDDVAALCLAQGVVNAPRLSTLCLDWNCIGPDGAAAIAEAMRAGSAHAGGGLRRVDLAHNRVVDAGAAALLGVLPRAPRVQHLGLGGNGIHSLAAVPRHALSSAGLRSLVLSGNHLGEGGAQDLARLLPAATGGLTALYLARNALGDGGAAALLAALEQHPGSVRCLDLAHNAVSPAGAAGVARHAASPRCRLIRIDLTGNPVGDEGWAALAAALPATPSVRWLTLRGCGVTTAESHRVNTDRGYRCRVDIRDDAEGSDSDAADSDSGG